MLHSPVYRKKYEQNLKREFPRLPFYADFFEWKRWGAELMDLHINYETREAFPLTRNDLDLSAKKQNKKDKTNISLPFDAMTGDNPPSELLTLPFTAGTNDDATVQPVSTGFNKRGLSQNEKDAKTPSDELSANLDHAVNSMANKSLKMENPPQDIKIPSDTSADEIFTVKPQTKLSADKEAGTITIDSHTTLTGVPSQAWEYKLGNRSAIEWILDQYKEKTPQDATIREHFNTYKFADYKEQVIDLIRKVTTVSVETMNIVNQMPTE